MRNIEIPNFLTQWCYSGNIDTGHVISNNICQLVDTELHTRKIMLTFEENVLMFTQCKMYRVILQILTRS